MLRSRLTHRAVAATACIAVGLAALLSLRATPESNDHAHAPENRGREIWVFASLDQMVATSDLVVIGTVDSVSTGRALGDGVAPDPDLQFMELSITATSSLHNNAGPVIQLEVETHPIGYSDAPVWFEPGTKAIFFLHEKADRPEWYRPSNSQGVFILDPATQRVVAGVSGAMTDAYSGLTLVQFQAEIDAAVRAVDAGLVQPLPRR